MMYDEIIKDIIKTLSLGYNKCFKTMSTNNNMCVIENSNYSSSSKNECRELLEIEAKLLQFEEYLDIEVSLEKIVITFK